MSKFNKNLQKAISISSTILGSILLFGVIGFFLKNKYDSYKVNCCLICFDIFYYIINPGMCYWTL